MESGQLLPGIARDGALGTLMNPATCSEPRQRQAVTMPAGMSRYDHNDSSVSAHRSGTAAADDKLDDALEVRRGQVTSKMLRDNFHLPLHTVAKKFGMCTTAFKKLCRRFEIPKWPHRQARGHPRCASHACSLQVLHVLALFLPHLLQPQN